MNSHQRGEEVLQRFAPRSHFQHLKAAFVDDRRQMLAQHKRPARRHDHFTELRVDADRIHGFDFAQPRSQLFGPIDANVDLIRQVREHRANFLGRSRGQQPAPRDQQQRRSHRFHFMQQVAGEQKALAVADPFQKQLSEFMSPDGVESVERLVENQQFRIVRESIDALHPGKAKLMTKPVTVRWGATPYSEGVSPSWPGNGGQGPRPPLYGELLKPEGPIVFAGEHLSYQPAWQEGAALSAHEALKLVGAMAVDKAGVAA